MTNRISVSLSICAYSLFYGGWSVNAGSEYERTYEGAPRTILARLSIGCEIPAISIVMTDNEPLIRPRGARLWIFKHDQKIPLQRFEQLRHLVRVTSPVQALKLVRMKTAFATKFAWLGPDEVEIISAAEISKIPNFGIPKEYFLSPNKENASDQVQPRSGYRGALSGQAYKKGRFTAARVEVRKGFFVITRWIYSSSNKNQNRIGCVLYIRETVSTDGSYSRKVLKKSRNPLCLTHFGQAK